MKIWQLVGMQHSSYLRVGSADYSQRAGWSKMAIWRASDSGYVLEKSLGDGEQTVVGTVFSRQGHLLAAAYLDGRIQVWSTGDWQQVAEIEVSLGSVNALRFDPGDRMLGAVTSTGHVLFFGLDDWSQQRKLVTGAEVSSIAFGPKGRLLAVGHRDGKLGLARNLRDDAVLSCLLRHRVKEDLPG